MSTHAPPDSQGLRTVDELARYFGIGRWSVYRLVRRGELRAVRVGERLRFRPEDIERYLEREHNRGSP